ncbi:MAG TPA: hypothetical protein VM925_20320 [Labilithrix sp.]|nr:hypothetical protein [Labilithrix sp.]
MRTRSSSPVSFLVSSAFVVAALATSSSAFADDPLPTPPNAPTEVKPAPGQAAASAPSPAAVPITATCSLGDHPGVDDAEARTGADVVCHELAKQGATNTQHEIRFGKLGGRTLVTVASRNGNAYDERRTLLTGMDELPVAAPRLAGSLSDGRSLEDTRTVDNVLASEARAPKVQRGQMGFDGGLFGMTGIGADAGAAGGVHMGLLYRAGSFGLSGHGRAGGIGSGDNKLGTASLDIGARYYFSTGEVAPFVGGGLGLAYFDLSCRRSNAMAPPCGGDGSGFAGYGLVGMEFFRAHHAALSASLRADAPFFALGSGSDSKYVVPLSLNVGFVFR